MRCVLLSFERWAVKLTLFRSRLNLCPSLHFLRFPLLGRRQSIPTVQPVIGRPMFGSHPQAAALNSLLFVSELSLSSGSSSPSSPPPSLVPHFLREVTDTPRKQVPSPRTPFTNKPSQ
jgi:hypothetical protein